MQKGGVKKESVERKKGRMVGRGRWRMVGEGGGKDDRGGWREG